VAPRIVGLQEPENLVARYEAVRSSLDLGHREAPVVPYGTVSYVPSAAIICRRTALKDVGGFDETLKSGEDVDLCWRFIEAGARLRYEPIALVGTITAPSFESGSYARHSMELRLLRWPFDTPARRRRW